MKLFKSSLALMALLQGVLLNGAEYSRSLLGIIPPDCEFGRVIGGDTLPRRLSDLRPKVVVIEFWATWCAPCIQAFSHLEELQKQFGSDLQVIAITDEPEERIQKFLEKRKVGLPLVIDPERKWANLLPHRQLPHTVILDTKGVVRVVATPDEIDSAVIKRVLSDEPSRVPEKRDRMEFDPAQLLSPNRNLISQVTVTPFQSGPTMTSSRGAGPYGERRVLAMNVSIQTLYEMAYRFPAGSRTLLEVADRTPFKWNKETALCFDLIVPEDRASRRFEIMQYQLNDLFGYRVKIEARPRKVKVLVTIPGEETRLPLSQVGTSEYMNSGAGYSNRAASIEDVAVFLESRIGKPVVDETGLTGAYDVTLDWYNEDRARIHEELKKVGLMLRDDERIVQTLIISDK